MWIERCCVGPTRYAAGMTESEEPQIEDAPNSAYALRDLLERVRVSGRNTFQEGWSTALGASFPSREFSERHSATMDLFSEVSGMVRAFPQDSRESRRYSPYLQKWHGYAIGYPSWNENRNLSKHLDVPVLDQLESLGQFLDSSDSYPSGRAKSTELARLLQSLESLKEAVSDSEVPQAVRDRIEYHLRQAEWFMAHASTFGAASVKKHANSAAAEGVGLFSRLKDEVTRQKVNVAVLSVLAALGHIDEATASVKGVIENVTGSYAAIEQVIEPDEAIEQGE